MFNPFRRYPVKAIILEKRQGNMRVIEDKATRVKEKDGSQFYYLLKKRIKIRPPSFGSMFMGKKGKNYMFVYSPDEGNFFPIGFDNPGGLHVQSKEMDTWRILMQQKAFLTYPKKQSFLEKYMPLVLLGITGAILCFITLFVMREMGTVASASAVAAQHMRDTMQLLVDFWSKTPPLT